jgi:hypothetical protein
MKRIPKILHMYWDKSPLSWLQAVTPISFNRYNPDWVINIYVPKQAYNGGSRYIPNYTGKDYFPVMKQQVPSANIIEINLQEYGIDLNLHNILRSDILRYHLLYTQGGVWSDFDVVWLKPMNYFDSIEYLGSALPDEITAVVSLVKGVVGWHSIGILIHTQHDEYAKSLIELTNQVKPPYSHEVFGSTMISTKYPTLESMSHFKGLVGVKHETYYPYDIHPPNPTFDRLYLADDLSFITKNTVCLHWYNGKELSKQYVNGSGFSRECSMTTVLKKEGYVL